MTIRRLVAKAAQTAGSEGAVADRLNVTPQRLSEWKHSHRPMPDQQVIALAELAGSNPQLELGRYRMERHQTGQQRLIASAQGARTPSALRATLHALRRLGPEADDDGLHEWSS